MLERYLFYVQYDKLSSFAVIITLLPLTLIVCKKAYVDPSIRLLLFYLAFKLTIDLYMFHCAANRMNNMLLLNLTVIFRYALLSGMFFYKYENPFIKKCIIPVTVAFTIFTVGDILYCNPNLYNLHEHRAVLYSMTVESLLMIFWTLLYFYELIRSLKIPSLLTFPFFWVCSGLLVYYSSLIFIAPALHYAMKWEQWLDIGFLDRMPYIFEIVIAILFSVGICVFSARHYARQ